MKSTMMGNSKTDKLYKIKNGSYYSLGKLWILYEHIYAYDNELIIKNAKKFFAIKHILDAYFMEHEYKNDLSFRTSLLDEYTCVPYKIRRKRSLYSFDGKCRGYNNIYTWFHYRVIEALDEGYVSDDKYTYEVIEKSNLDKETKNELRLIVSNKIDINDKNINEIRKIAQTMTNMFFYDINREHIESDIVDYVCDFDSGYMAFVFLILLRNGFPSHIPFNITRYTTSVTMPHVMRIDQLLFANILISNIESSKDDILSTLLANDDRLLNDLYESGSSLLCKSLPQ